MQKKGFTLIELLIVVAIIGILAAIAIPNFLQAQTRAKVARAKAEMQSLATALESYYVDNNDYPNDNEYEATTGRTYFWYVSSQVTSPIKYISNNSLYDPFRDQLGSSSYTMYRRYRFVNYEATKDLWPPVNGGARWVPSGNDALCDGGTRLFGNWKLSSAGPDRNANGVPTFLYLDPPNDLIYDPTNGTTSVGDVMRCQKMAEFKAN